MSERNLYAERDTPALGEFYTRHVMAMTAEGLHAKSAIAAELAYRDANIDILTNNVEEAQMDVSHYEGLIAQISGAIGATGDTSKLPELVAKLAAREKLYTETVKALEYEFTTAIKLREDLMGREPIQLSDGIRDLLKTTPHLRQLLSLAGEASEAVSVDRICKNCRYWNAEKMRCYHVPSEPCPPESTCCGWAEIEKGAE